MRGFFLIFAMTAIAFLAVGPYRDANGAPMTATITEMPIPYADDTVGGELNPVIAMMQLARSLTSLSLVVPALGVGLRLLTAFTRL